MYQIAKKLLKSNFTRLESPCKITFAVTYACTFLCKTCNIGRNYLKNPKEVMQNQLTYDEIGKIFKNAKPSWLQITGGEPFIRDMYEILKAIVENDSELYAVSTTTNGFATQTIIESVKKILTLKIPKFVVSVSFDGFESHHEEIRGIENSFKKCIETFNELKLLENQNKNFRVFITYTSSPHNMGKLESFIKNMKDKYGIDQKYIHMNLYHQSSHFYENTNQQKTDEYNEKVLNEIKKYGENNKWNGLEISFFKKAYAKFAEKFVKTGKTPLPCKALNSSMFLDPYGNVFPCLIWNKKLGNLRNYDYDVKKLWNDPEVVKTQKDAENLNCPQCWTPCEAYPTIAGNLIRLLR